MKNLKVYLLLFLFAILVSISGLGCADTPDVDTPEVVDEVVEKVIKIGYTAPFTGAAAEFGINGWRGIEIALDEINEEGIVINGEKHVIEIIRYDDLCVPSDGVAAVNKMIFEDEVVAFLGSHCSSVCMAIAELADQYEIPGLTIECAAEGVTKPGHEYYFRMLPDMGLVAPLTAKEIFDLLEIKTISFLGVNDDYGKSWVEGHEEAFAELGVETLSKDYFERGSTDYTILLSKIKGLNPDMVGYVGVTPEGGMIIQQARELGLIPEIKFFGAAEFSTYEMLELIGAEALEGTYALSLTTFPPDFTQKIRDRYNAPLHYASIFGYDALYVVADAIERAQSLDPPTIRDYLKEGTYDTLAGFTEFRDFDGYTNQGVYSPYIVEWVDGEMKFY
ncbi:MAG: ABC transporter substrate-binding protein [Bacillota bacterium]|nr:ABC transporter substrate-binding protein [Bacillota bacterium]